MTDYNVKIYINSVRTEISKSRGFRKDRKPINWVTKDSTEIMTEENVYTQKVFFNIQNSERNQKTTTIMSNSV